MKLCIRSIPLVVAFMVWGLPSFGAESEERVKLVLVRGPIADKQCHSQAYLMAEIKRQLSGRNVFDANSSWSFEVVITSERGQFQARIDERRDELPTTSLPSETEIPGGARDCNLLMKWIAITVARLIDPTAPPPPRSPTTRPLFGENQAPRSTAEVSSELPANRSDPPPGPSIPQQSSAMTMTVVARGGFRTGFVPNMAAELAIFAGVGRGRWEASLGTSWTLQSAEKKTLTSGTVEQAFGMNVIWLGGCFHPLSISRVVLSTCAYLGGGAIDSVVLSLTNARPLDVGQAPWVGLSLQPRLRIRALPNLTLELGVDVAMPVSRYRYRVKVCAPDDEDCSEYTLQNVFQQEDFGVSGFFGVGMSIP